MPLQIASVVVTFFTGVALAVFAWLTYRHSRQVAELRYAPILEVRAVGSPQTGEFSEGDYAYYGVRWEICLTNPGDAPVLAEGIDVTLHLLRQSGDARDSTSTSVNNLCDLVDEQGEVLAQRAVGVPGSSQRRLTVCLCREGMQKEEHRLFKPGDRVSISVAVFQSGRLGKGSGWAIGDESGVFELPERFDKVSSPTF